jgi:hypothetical protein
MNYLRLKNIVQEFPVSRKFKCRVNFERARIPISSQVPNAELLRNDLPSTRATESALDRFEIHPLEATCLVVL